MGDNVQVKSSRRRAAIGLVLAIVLALGVIGAMKISQDRAARSAVMLSSPELPENDSAQCAEFTEAMPSSMIRLQRAELMEPVPEGATLYRDYTDDRLTIRCGTPVPMQYNSIAHTTEVDGITWLTVSDPTPGLDLTTWYSVGTSPVVAVTGRSDHERALGDVSEIINEVGSFGEGGEPGPIPLMDLPLAEGSEQRCNGVLSALPEELADRERLEGDNLPEDADLPAGGAAWGSASTGLVTVRCGVEEPTSYAESIGDQLTQIGNVVWFNDPELSSGDTSVYFALSHEEVIAVYMPVGEAQAVLPALSNAISANLDEVSSE
ncbi:DUF3515 domain-containing protein [Corynebacterium sputi]|uniref:DUF3515 domain-containing protein n=1 Tax=Corynebacterium sputi TaxID=489915 RepID=UPI000428153E|nr:DUF3515 domain-containing protein [Corynebacterium sputi]